MGKLKKFNRIKLKEPNEMALTDMYSINKQLMLKEPLLDYKGREDAKAELHSYIEFADYALLCRERYDFTLFRITQSRVQAIEEIMDVITSRGSVISIDKQEDDTWEFWVKIDDDAFMYKFFKCDWAIDC